MCGIAGLFSKSAETVSHGVVAKMTNALRHRGPDADGFFQEGPISLGHRRLSIIDLSASANQPFMDASGRYVIVFNGELYNFREVRDTLPDYPFRTQGDTEVLLAAYARWGVEGVRRLKGMFAFAIWDRLEQSLFLCRDRMGVKPLYFSELEGGMVFASEIRAVLASGLVPARLDRNALLDYLSFQSFNFPDSPIEGIQQLEAGSWLKIRGNGRESGRYWAIGEQMTAHDMDDPVAVRRSIRDLLTGAVERRMVSDVPVGAFLSGGIDSSTVVGLMAEVSTQAPSTFNISFSEKEFDETPYAEMVARKFNTRHTTIRLKPEILLEELDNALSAMDSPSADGPNTYVVSKAIRQAGITVALSGIGGDELFAGYPFFRHYLNLQKKRTLFDATTFLRKPFARLLDLSSQGRIQRITSLLSSDTLAIESVYPEFRRILTPAQIGKLTSLQTGGPTALQKELQMRQPVFRRLPLLSQVSAAEYVGYTQNTLLKDADQMSMAVSLEVREPFFDHDLIEYMLQVPDALKYPVYPKSLLVDSVKPLLPDEIVHRKKQGFLFPWAVWLKGPLREFCSSHLNRLCSRDFIHANAMLDLWSRFLKGDTSVRWTDLWLFVVLEHWLEKNHVEA
jgi:asparagine synthase (glutamine-hydrolysing)